MIRQIKQVEAFHKAFGHHVQTTYQQVPPSVAVLREKLISEEAKEVSEAIMKGDLTNLAKELADLAYVLFGTVVSYGLTEQFERVFDEVQSSNMSKLGEDGKPIYNEYNKIMKGPNYFEANIARALGDHTPQSAQVVLAQPVIESTTPEIRVHKKTGRKNNVLRVGDYVDPGYKGCPISLGKNYKVKAIDGKVVTLTSGHKDYTVLRCQVKARKK